MKVNKNPLVWIAVVVFLAVFVFWMLNSDIEPIEDTNGADNFALTTITDENIISMDMGALNPVKISESNVVIGGWDLDADVTFSSKNFSGVYEVLYNHYFPGSDFVLRLNYLKVNSGNFKMVVLLDDEIVGTIEPSDDSIEFMLEDIGGTVSLRIAGESAEYEFSMFKTEYEDFAHP